MNFEYIKIDEKVLSVIEESTGDTEYVTEFSQDIVLKYFNSMELFEEELNKFASQLSSYARYNFIKETADMNYSDEYAEYRLFFKWNNKYFCFYEMCEKYGDDDYIAFSKFQTTEYCSYNIVDVNKMLEGKLMVDRDEKIKKVIYKSLEGVKEEVKYQYDIDSSEFKNIVREYLRDNNL